MSLLSLLLASSDPAYASAWVRMSLSESESVGYQFARCYYKSAPFTGHDFSVAIMIEGSKYSCPYSIYYNPVTGTWSKEPQY